ncbi:protein roadkill-like [Trichogramma pretiosum]|uniref:protein roadkill-like n=1 Tax=Trichogramma pretiosum TaxID=7493 RepID=UPI000C719781|nr:protein roadkill-like [Trichogramma pretiosum]
MSNDLKMECFAEIEHECFNFTWVIKNYFLIMGKEGPLSSHRASIDIDHGIQLQLYFKQNDSNNRYVILYLYLHGLKNDTDKKKFSYKISVIKDDQIVYTRMDFPDKALGEKIFEMERKDISKFVSSTGTLTIHCELTYATGNLKQFLNNKSVVTNEVPKLKFDWILLDENLADIKLQTAEIKEIPAHRVVLAAASPVFKAMFSHDMLENKSQSVDMTDINYEAAVEMLRYIYTGSVKDSRIFVDY